MLLPARMHRIEIVVHREYFDDVLAYLRESQAIELVDVKEILKGYEGTVEPSPPSPRLYKLSSMSSRIGNLVQSLAPQRPPASPMTAMATLSDTDLQQIESHIAQIESTLTDILNRLGALRQYLNFADEGMNSAVAEVLETREADSPEERHKLEGILERILTTIRGAKILKTISEDQQKSEAALKMILIGRIRDSLKAHRDGKELKRILKAALELDNGSVKAGGQVQELEAKVRLISAEHGPSLLMWNEMVTAERVLEEAKGVCGKTQTTCLIEGWIPGEKLHEIEQGVAEVSRGHAIFRSWLGGTGPTKLRNPRSAALFERLTIGFGTPTSGEIDPTILWLVTYPFFFGLMFGDVGHGLIVIGISLMLFLAKRRGIKLSDQSFIGLGGLGNMVIEGSPLLTLGGAAALTVGFFYGTFLGSEEWFAELFGIHGPLWFSPWHEPMKLLKISVIIGIVHVTSGLLLDVVNKVRHREYAELIAGPLSWLWFYLTFGYLILQFRFGLISFVMSRGIETFLLLGIPSLFMLVMRTRVHGAVDGFGHWMESMLASISHTVSYARILAMKMIHDAFSLLFIDYFIIRPAGSVVGAALGSIAFVTLTFIMIIILETAFVFLQSLRLHWVEWFLKFYVGGGIQFRPFGVSREYTVLPSRS